MKTCSFCAEPIQDVAFVCPHCRHHQPEPARPPKNGSPAALSRDVLTWIIVVAATAAFAYWQLGAERRVSASGLKADVGQAVDFLVIKNADSRVWTDIRIRVNATYEGRLDTMKPGDERSVPLRQFATDSGKRFDPLLSAVKTIHIDAKVSPDGTRASGGWTSRY